MNVVLASAVLWRENTRFLATTLVLKVSMAILQANSLFNLKMDE